MTFEECTRFGRRRSLSRPIGALWGAMLGLVLCLSTASAAFAQQPHWDWHFEISVDAPQTTGDLFRVQVLKTLAGPQLVTPQLIEAKYRVVATRPDASERLLAGTLDRPATDGANIGGAFAADTYSFTPDQNGEWTFTVLQRVGNSWTIAAQRQTLTDKSVASPPPRVAGSRTSTLDVEPSTATVGEPVTIAVKLEGYPDVTALPVSLLTDGIDPQSLGVIQLSNGQGSLVWVPGQPLADGQGQLQVGSQLVPVVVLAAPADTSVATDAGGTTSEMPPPADPPVQESPDSDVGQ